MTSSSRGSGVDWISWASPMRRLVSPAIAEGTTTIWWPFAFQRATRRATALMRSTPPTEVPPYFWTMSAMTRVRRERGFYPMDLGTPLRRERQCGLGGTFFHDEMMRRPYDAVLASACALPGEPMEKANIANEDLQFHDQSKRDSAQARLEPAGLLDEDRRDAERGLALRERAGDAEAGARAAAARPRGEARPQPGEERGFRDHRVPEAKPA